MEPTAEAHELILYKNAMHNNNNNKHQKQTKRTSAVGCRLIRFRTTKSLAVHGKTSEWK